MAAAVSAQLPTEAYVLFAAFVALILGAVVSGVLVVATVYRKLTSQKAGTLTKWAGRGVLLTAIGGGLLVTLVPPFLDNLLNKVDVDHAAIRAVTPESLAFHRNLAVADLHADPLMYTYRKMNLRSDKGHTDLPRFLEGNIAIEGFYIVSKIPLPMKLNNNTNTTDLFTAIAVTQAWPLRTYSSLVERGLYQAQHLHKLAAESNGLLRVLKTQQDVVQFEQDWAAERAAAAAAADAAGVLPPPTIMAGFLGIEGMHLTEGRIENVNKLIDAGFRVMGITHFLDNEYGGSAHGVQPQYGLTAAGIELIKHLNARSITIDLAHAGAMVIDDVLRLTTKPVLVSHTGVRGTCDNDRNLRDDQLKRIAALGGVVGISFFPTCVCGHKVEDIVRSIRYTTNLIGTDAVALGSDFDGSVTVPIDAANMAALTHALLADGYTKDQVTAIMGGNVHRFLRTNLPSAPTA